MAVATEQKAPARESTTGGKSMAQRLGRLPLHLAVIALMLAWSIPTIALVVSSFRPPADIATSGWWMALSNPFGWTLDNYNTVLDQRGLGRAFVNSFIITVPATLIVILVAALAAYAFAWMRFPGQDLLLLVMVGLLVVPVQMTLIPVLRLYVELNVDVTVPIIGGNLFGTNSYPGIWLAHAALGLPFGIYLLRNFFGGLPRDLIEAALLDGASDFAVFVRIVLPLSMPAIAALGIFQFLWTWNDLLIALVLMGDPELAPMTPSVTNLVSSFGGSYQLLTAAAFLSMVVPLIVFFVLQRYFVQGLLSGAVKG
jgi:alpha-glucoside transport system permease protein